MLLVFAPVLKAEVAAIKTNIKLARGSVPVLGHKCFVQQPTLFCCCWVLALDKSHHVAVSLDRSRLAQIGQPRQPAAVALDDSIHLRKSDDRKVQL